MQPQPIYYIQPVIEQPMKKRGVAVQPIEPVQINEFVMASPKRRCTPKRASKKTSKKNTKLSLKKSRRSSRSRSPVRVPKTIMERLGQYIPK
jgi:hypothetical protein